MASGLIRAALILLLNCLGRAAALLGLELACRMAAIGDGDSKLLHHRCIFQLHFLKRFVERHIAEDLVTGRDAQEVIL